MPQSGLVAVSRIAVQSRTGRNSRVNSIACPRAAGACRARASGKTAPWVQSPRRRGRRTRARRPGTRILDVAEESILAKGFDATSIEEIVAGAEITRSGFFYHFPDKNALARALLERYIEQDRVRARRHLRAARPSSATTRCTRFLIALKLFAEIMADLPNGHPGCIVATVCYQERLFDAEVRELNRAGGAGLARALPRRARADRRALPAARPGRPRGARRHDLDRGRGRHRHGQGAARAAGAGRARS